MIIYNARIFLETTVIENGYILVEKGIIREAAHSPCPYDLDESALNAEGNIIAPGYINEHIHGGAGFDMMDGNLLGMHIIASQLLQEGVTSFLATTMTLDTLSIEKVCRMAGEFRCSPNEAQMIGLHLEGPFINPRYVGAQKAENILPPDPALADHWLSLSGYKIKMLTYAVEQDNANALLSFLTKNNIAASCGHSNATYSEIVHAHSLGLNCLTHFNNAMSKWDSRNPGVVTAGLSEDVFVELIADGIHVHPDTIRATYKIKGPDKIILITDSNRAKSLPDGCYSLGGQEFEKKDNICTLPNGSLAGSVLRMDDAVKNMVQYTGCTLHQAVNMATVNPAKNIGVFDNKGSVEPGKDADLIMLDQTGNVLKVITSSATR